MHCHRSLSPLAAAPRKHCDDTRSLYRCDDFATNRDDLRDAKESQRAQSTPVRGVQSQQAQSTLVRGVSGGVPGYAFNVITIRHALHGHGDGHPFGMNQIVSKPFGIYATLQECDAARAVKIAQLDDAYLRFAHLPANAHEKVTHLQGGSVIVEKDGSYERMDVAFCEPGVYSPGGGSPNGVAQSDIQTTGAATPTAQTTTLEVSPGFVKHWIAPRPFTRVIPGTSEVLEVLSAASRELIFMVKPDVALPPTTNILLVDDNGEVVANLRIVIPETVTHELHQGPNGSQIYRKDNPNYVPPKEKK